MIVPSWITMREQWSDLGTVDADGIKTWNAERVHGDYVASQISVTRSGLLEYTFTAPFNVDWCLLQSFDMFALSQPTPTTLVASLTNSAALLTLPNGWVPSTRRQWLRTTWIYSKRVANDSIAGASLAPLVDLAASASTTL